MIVSVVIPTFRRHRDLLLCLDRLAPGRQEGATHVGTLANGPREGLPFAYEVVVSDDGDVEETRRMLGARASWVKLVQGPRKGPAANRNNAVANAAGEWLAFTDDDCLPDPGWLGAYWKRVDSGANVLEGKTITDEPHLGIFSIAPTNLAGGMLWSCNMFFRKSAFLEVGGFDEKFPYPHMEDVDLRDRVVSRFGRFAFVPDAVILHPQRIQKPGWRMAKRQESNFYYARKRGCSLAAAGFNFAVLVRVPVRQLALSPFTLQSVEYAFRMTGYLLSLAPLSIVWKIKYRK